MTLHSSSVFCLVPPLCLAAGLYVLRADQGGDTLSVRPREDGAVGICLAATGAGRRYRLSFSNDLAAWTPMATLEGNGLASLDYRDGSASGRQERFYSVEELPVGDASLTGDHFVTSAGLVTVHPVAHASLVMQWEDVTIYNDPVGGAAGYAGLPEPDLILVGHRHGDHYSATTLSGIVGGETVIVAPRDVFDQMATGLRGRTVVVANGGSVSVVGLTVDAVPAYNANHPQGRDNGYVVTIGTTRIYLSGDTGDTPEMRALADIDIAFLAMNIPFTMSVDEAAAAARAFQPAVIYPYHYRNQDGSFADLARLDDLVNSGASAAERIDVRERDWY